MEKGGRPQVAVWLDGVSPPAWLDSALAPLSFDIRDVGPWPGDLGGSDASEPLRWLASRTRGALVLGLTRRSVLDAGGIPLRGLSRFGEGVALVTGHGLDALHPDGVVRHEMGHALGLPHCAAPACTLSERVWPAGADDRPPAFCDRCAALWQNRASGVSS